MGRDRRLFEPEHEEFRRLARRFFEKEVIPYREEWEASGVVDRDMYCKAAEWGVLGFGVPEAYGGLGLTDYRYNVVAAEESLRSGVATALSLLNDTIAPYLLTLATEEQRARWLPGLARGELIFALAMTEPGAGSDLGAITTSARHQGDGWVVNGQKTFISNGILADIAIVVARTNDLGGHRGLSLIAVESTTPGFTRGRRLEKLGLRAQDTAELFFADTRVPFENLLGEEGKGFYHLMANLPAERLSIAIASAAGAELALAETLEYAKTRTAFGRPIGAFQANRFTLAELATEVAVARTFVDDCIVEMAAGSLDPVRAAKAKWWTSELYKRVVDRCLQLHGGYGYMLEYPIARMYRDARVMTIFGGTTEIMKEIIGRDLGV